MTTENTNPEKFTGFNIQQIMEILPHRYPFLLVDRVEELIPMEYIKAYKNVTYNEGFFQGHFPEQPVMPGVLIVEALAQTGIILVASSVPDPKSLENKLYVFAGIESVRFRRQVVPGDKLELVCSNPKNRMALWKMDAKAYVNGQLAVEGRLTAAVIDKE